MKKVTKADIKKITRLQEQIEILREKYQENDIELHYGNGSVSDQLSVASAGLECIIQEY